MASESEQEASTLSTRWVPPNVDVAKLPKYSKDLGLRRTNFITRTCGIQPARMASRIKFETNKSSEMFVVHASSNEVP